MANERLTALREEMKRHGITLFVVPTADFHESEYVGDYFKARMYLTGFSGSAGTAVITMEEAGLWTDGRYFIQAEKQIQGKDVTLYRMGEEGVPTVKEFITSHLDKGGCIGFDGRVINTSWGEELESIAAEKEAAVKASEDLVSQIWKDRPELPKEKIYLLDEKYSGESTQSKLQRVRQQMEEAGASVHILTSLYDIAWLYNIRGNDIPSVPVVLAFTLLTKQDAFLFLHDDVLTNETRKYLEDNHVTVLPYEGIYEKAEEISANETVLLSKAVTNYRITSSLNKEIKVIDQTNPSMLMKARKNPVEVKNTISAHVKDGVAFTKFMYYMKKNIGKTPMTELSAQEYLADRRKEQDGFIELSFDTICAYEANAAMMHYQAKPDNFSELKPQGLLLIDSGGHYYEGTTDITRTITLGEITPEQRFHFTTVVRSMLSLANAKFLYGCTGQNLDILARGPMWDMGLDYKCGTGHGVGYVLNVHEGPNGFRWRLVAERNDSGVLEEGHITTDEPGVYLEGKYGIRIENELVCRKAEKNEYGQFMDFEQITYAPIDLDAIDPGELSRTEKNWLNDYHANVYRTISPYMTDDEKVWLKEYTRAI